MNPPSSSSSLRHWEMKVLDRFLEKATSAEWICADCVIVDDACFGLREAVIIMYRLEFGGVARPTTILLTLLLVFVFTFGSSGVLATIFLFVLPVPPAIAAILVLA